MGEISIRDSETRDVEAITAIQNAFIGSAAIEWTDAEYSVDDRRAWLEAQRAAGYPVLVAVRAGEVVGWASFGEFRDTARWPGYRLTVEHTIHVRHDQWGRGVGRRLIDALVERAINRLGRASLARFYHWNATGGTVEIRPLRAP